MAEKKAAPIKTSRVRTATGMGWGGPAKGAGNGKPRHEFDKAPGPGRGHYSLEGEARLERQARHAEEMRQVLYGLATSEVAEDNIRMQSSEKMLNRLEGMPIQKVVTAETDPVSMMNEEQLEAHLEQTRRKVAKLAALAEAGESEHDRK